MIFFNKPSPGRVSAMFMYAACRRCESTSWKAYSQYMCFLRDEDKETYHDLGGHINHVGVVHVDLVDHNREPVQPLLNVCVECGGDSGRDGQADEWREAEEVARVDAHEEVVKKRGLPARL